MTINELLEAMREASIKGAEDGEGITIAELCKAGKMGQQRARAMVRQLIAEGAARPAQKWITDLCGIRRRVPSYVLEEKPAPKGRAKAA